MRETKYMKKRKNEEYLRKQLETLLFALALIPTIFALLFVTMAFTDIRSLLTCTKETATISTCVEDGYLSHKTTVERSNGTFREIKNSMDVHTVGDEVTIYVDSDNIKYAYMTSGIGGYVICVVVVIISSVGLYKMWRCIGGDKDAVSRTRDRAEKGRSLHV